MPNFQYTALKAFEPPVSTVADQEDRMAQVFVWRPKLKFPNMQAPTTAEKALSAIQNVGHASLLCDRAQSLAYVSYWPSEPVGGAKADASSPSFKTPSYAQDVAAEGGAPDFSIDLESLDDDNISQWWRKIFRDRGAPTPYALEYLPKDDQYNLWRTNCSAIVAFAMKIGGAEKFCPIPNFDTITPSHIEIWARAIAVSSGVSDFVSKGLKKIGI